MTTLTCFCQFFSPMAKVKDEPLAEKIEMVENQHPRCDAFSELVAFVKEISDVECASLDNSLSLSIVSCIPSC